MNKKLLLVILGIQFSIAASGEAIEWKTMGEMCVEDYGYQSIPDCLNNIQTSFDNSEDCDMGAEVVSSSTVPTLSAQTGCSLRRTCTLVQNGAQMGGSGTGCGDG